jgi:predicted nucleotidyltransferase
MGIDELRAKREQILQVARRHGVRHIRLFGSTARGDSSPGSDVDFLIEVEGPTPPWFPGGLVAELENLLGCQVDVVEPAALREALREAILSEAVAL